MILINIDGEEKSIKEWSRDTRCIVNYDTLYYRITAGWDPYEAIKTPPPETQIITAWGEHKTIDSWAEDERCRVCVSTLRSRLNNNWPTEKAIATSAMREFYPETCNVSKKYRVGDQEKTLSEWANDPMCEVSYNTLFVRIKRGKNIRDALKRNLKKDDKK